MSPFCCPPSSVPLLPPPLPFSLRCSLVFWCSRLAEAKGDSVVFSSTQEKTTLSPLAPSRCPLWPPPYSCGGPGEIRGTCPGRGRSEASLTIGRRHRVCYTRRLTRQHHKHCHP